MPDREKVILALELCRYSPDPGQEKKWNHSCLKCPYCTDRNGMEMNCAQMYTDAIALLREQEPVRSKEIIFNLGDNGDPFLFGWECGSCGERFSFSSYGYCPKCGRKVKWHD